MDWKAETETETELAVLKRIVAMLFALAGLADRASRASRPMRFFVLWLLRRAETVVREFVAGPADDVRLAVREGGNASDALDLAMSLRALARDIEALIAQYRRSRDGCRRRHAAGAANPPLQSGGGGPREAWWRGHMRPCIPPRHAPPDTS